MDTIIEYIINNYTWFLAGSIIILLAIIGYYADKTNFGQKKDNQENIQMTDDIEGDKEIYINQPSIEKENVIEEKTLTGNKQNTIPTESISKSIKNNQPEIELDSDLKANKEIDNKEINELNLEQNDIADHKEFELNFEKFDKEFNELLPKKDIIDDELLDEIDNLSLDKTQKLKLTDIPDLDDLELPKIKSLESDNEDIWNF